MSGNILQDDALLTAQMDDINTDVPPEAFAREPTAVDYYIGLVDAWKKAEEDEIIEITPTNVSQIAQKVLPSSYNDDDVELGGYASEDNVSLHDLVDKIDATYNKLCSLEQTDADLVESLTHVNDYLDSIHQQGARNQITTEKSIQMLRSNVASLTEGQLEIRKSIAELSTKLACIQDTILRMSGQ